MPIIKRGNIFWLDVTLGGKRHRESLGTSNQREAKKRAAVRERELWEASAIKPEDVAPSPDNHDVPPPLTPCAEKEGHKPRFDTEEEFKTAFGLFRELSPSIPWKATTAAKDHIDDFGGRIKRGEVHYTRSYPPAFHNVERLSRKSMEAVLCVLFRNNQEIEALAQELRKVRFDRERVMLETAFSGWNTPDIPQKSDNDTSL